MSPTILVVHDDSSSYFQDLVQSYPGCSFHAAGPSPGYHGETVLYQQPAELQPNLIDRIVLFYAGRSENRNRGADVRQRVEAINEFGNDAKDAPTILDV